VIQSNTAGNITGSLTTIAQDGFARRGSTFRTARWLYLYPSISFPVSKWGTHDFKAGVELYPFLRTTARAATIAPGRVLLPSAPTRAARPIS